MQRKQTGGVLNLEVRLRTRLLPMTYREGGTTLAPALEVATPCANILFHNTIVLQQL